MKLVVVGAEGRMGRMLIRAVAEAEGCTLHGAVERAGSPALGQDAGRLAGIGDLGVSVSDDPLSLFVAADGVLDFTVPAATVAFAELAAQARIVHVVGTTGLSQDDLKRLEAASYHARLVRSGNMSLGVNLLAGLVRKVAATLGEAFDIEVLEMHHRMKVDAPSGTALLLGEAAAEGRRVSLAETRVSTRDGHTGARRPGDIGFATLRGGSVVGDHSVIFAGPSERITLSHHAEDRGIFARGAVRAAQWAFDQPPGLYGMDDVLGLRD
ncbi:4-hydroxy-tetrahydrodipicolinate reductase [Methylorubrum aminovorans]|uniref:4-hydroxy-tetrahydrodipicolinate reductase n=1 Tax=Methylorubrum aminovorans TaxID=269069 RepID=A0ABQ4U6W5_9HYPH|nr:4-hydroxy-tetrahydrodipicolinate reductase [Methylorubrum aminovorans]GJE63056.1 4-hydroxy-tetrahydrodipicolinate reductase [Methylorubrum aminovorans]GMA79081.1 4-hydroxy-tetrahydrodipicolinate reductase [Methylorubrum aminovorans]